MKTQHSTHLETQEISIGPPTHPDVVCTACGNKTSPTFLGIQQLPESVADNLAIEPVVNLWRCNACGTSFTTTRSTE